MAFRPCPWLSQRHLQTLAGACWARQPLPPLAWEAWTTPDGDRVDLGWSGPAAGRTAIVLPGLDGNEHSHYVSPLLRALHRHGWRTVLLCARGTSGHPNRQPRSYHSGFTDDLEALTLRLVEEGPVGAVGISVGGNQLLRWMGHKGAACPLVAAAAAGVPYDLARCDQALSRGFSRVYQRHLVRGLVRAYRAKGCDYGLNEQDWRRLDSFRAVDARLTAPLHGFPDVATYYREASSRPWVPKIRVPTRLIHADDDPFVPSDALPDALPPWVTLERYPHGGHVGFRHGWRGRPWLEERLADLLTRAADCPRPVTP